VTGDELITGYSLRAATAGDLPEIKRMIRYARLNPMGIRWPRFIVAVDVDGNVIGCGQVKVHRDGSRELASLVVRRRWRRQGVARAIFNRLRREETEALWLTCASRLIPFYHRLGFYEVKNPRQMPRYFRLIRRLVSLIAFFWGSRDYLAIMRTQE
jgi:N-acetylglutamate synthase-like GNAT family acetyltransferase